eukprot:5775314-Pyramimonas_sp.AAC.1
MFVAVAFSCERDHEFRSMRPVSSRSLTTPAREHSSPDRLPVWGPGQGDSVLRRFCLMVA